MPGDSKIRLFRAAAIRREAIQCPRMPIKTRQDSAAAAIRLPGPDVGALQRERSRPGSEIYTGTVGGNARSRVFSTGPY